MSADDDNQPLLNGSRGRSAKRSTRIVEGSSGQAPDPATRPDDDEEDANASGGGDDGESSPLQKHIGMVLVVLLILCEIGLIGFLGTYQHGARFLFAFVPAIGLLAALQLAPELNAEDLRVHPIALAIAFIVGVFAKLVGFFVSIATYFTLLVFSFDLENPHAPMPLTVGETLLRISIVAFVLVSLVEEAIKLMTVISLDDEDTSLGKKLNIYNPFALVQLSIAVSLGTVGWNLTQDFYVPEHGLSPFYRYWSAFLEPCLSLGTGAVLGAGVARRLYLRKSVSNAEMLLPASLMRAIFFFFVMFPLRSGEISEVFNVEGIDPDIPPDPLSQDREVPNATQTIYVGHWLALLYLGVTLLIAGFLYYARTQVMELLYDWKHRNPAAQPRSDSGAGL
jgi:hypothetical protein